MGLLWNGKNMNYTHGYSMVIANFISLIAGIIIIISLLLHAFIKYKLIKLKIKTKVAQSKSKEEELTENPKYENMVAPLNTNKDNMCVIIKLEKISDTIFWIGILLMTLIFPVLSGF